MIIDDLNRRYGAPGRIVFRAGHAGYPNVVIANKYGTAEIALMSGNVLSYRPTGHSEVIFRPAKRDYNRSESMHGGIPVCWPQFGNRFSKSLPQHGIARLMLFDVRGTEYSEDMTEITLGLKSNDDTRSMWPHDFDLEFKVSVSMKLNLTLTTVNTGREPFDFSCGFHPYFLIASRNDVTVKGLGGCRFIDGTKAELPEGKFDGDIKMDFAPDHIFYLNPAPKHELALLDPKLRRAIAVVASGCNNAVVWNSGDEQLDDCGPDDWRKFVCVEPVSDWPGGRTLKPGEKHRLMAAIQSNMEGCK